MIFVVTSVCESFQATAASNCYCGLETYFSSHFKCLTRTANEHAIILITINYEQLGMEGFTQNSKQLAIEGVFVVQDVEHISL